MSFRLFVDGEDESYFANLEMQVSIPAAVLGLSLSGRRLRKDARNKTLSSLLFPGEIGLRPRPFNSAANAA
jgi:hypothetical protein